MTTHEPPLPNLLGFFADDEDKEFQASLARDRADISLWSRHFAHLVDPDSGLYDFVCNR
jgi:hypothetical protein